MRAISISIPAELFIEFAARVKGDPSEEIEHLIRRHLARLDQVVVEMSEFDKVTGKEFLDGDPKGGLEWSPIWLPNGTDLRMRYRQQTFYGKVRFDTIHYNGVEYNSVSQWVRHVARGTARNSWHDVWVRFVDSDEFVYADALRQVPRTGIPLNGETPDARIRRLGALALLDIEQEIQDDAKAED